MQEEGREEEGGGGSEEKTGEQCYVRRQQYFYSHLYPYTLFWCKLEQIICKLKMDYTK